MRYPILSGLCLATPIFVCATRLATDYSLLRTFEVTAKSSLSMETTRFEVLVDGEPMERGDRGGAGGSSSAKRQLTWSDTYLAQRDGAPTKLKRSYGELSIDDRSGSEDRAREDQRSGPLTDLVLEISLDEEGETRVKLLEGEAPSNGDLFEDLVLALPLDVLLPEDAVDMGASWGLDADGLASVLGLAFHQRFFPALERQEGEGGERSGDRGPGRGGRGSGGSMRLLEQAKWTGTGKLVELEPGALARIELKLHSKGALPEREGGRRGFAFHPAAEEGAQRVEGSYEVELEGYLLFALDAKHPTQLVLEGTLFTEQETTRERGDRSMQINTAQEGSFQLEVEITAK